MASRHINLNGIPPNHMVEFAAAYGLRRTAKKLRFSPAAHHRR